MNQVEVTNRIADALKKLYRNDVYLIETQQHERAICAKLACYLQENFPDWNVDVDYNRDGKDPKKTLDGDRRLPDIIIHRRGTEGPNLVALEAKGHWKSAKHGIRKDERTLKGLRLKFGYQYTFLIQFCASEGRLTFVPPDEASSS